MSGGSELATFLSNREVRTAQVRLALVVNRRLYLLSVAFVVEVTLGRRLTVVRHVRVSDLKCAPSYYQRAVNWVPILFPVCLVCPLVVRNSAIKLFPKVYVALLIRV